MTVCLTWHRSSLDIEPTEPGPLNSWATDERTDGERSGGRGRFGFVLSREATANEPPV